MKKNSSLLDYTYPGLSADIWQADGTLLPYHKDYILKLITAFYDTYKFKNPEAWVKDITNVGSLTTNKYVRSSDFDCHVVVDLKEFQRTNMPDSTVEEAALYLDNARKEWDRAKILLPFGEHPLELYFESELSPSNTKAVGRYSLVSNTWLKEPVYFAQDLDYEESKRAIVEEAIKIANELDASFGNIRRDIQRIDELKQVAQAWPADTRQLYMDKIQGKINSIEEEITKAIALQQALIDERHEKQDPFSENEIKFKYLARFFYFYVISELKDLMKKTDGEVTETELPIIRKIVNEASKKEAGQVMRFNNAFGDTFRVFKDPTSDQTENLWNNSMEHELRYLLDDSGVYIWDAFYAEHEEVAAELGIGSGTVNRIGYINNAKDARKWGSASSKVAAKDPEATETDICVDFDHTIAQGAKFPAIGEPIDGAKEGLAKLKELGYTIIIYSCRGESKEGAELVRDWLDTHDMPYDSIFEGEKPFAKYYIDDRAIRFDTWNNVLKQVEKSDKTASLSITADKTYTREELERMDIDDLDRMAYGYASGDIVTLSPSQIRIQYPVDLSNPEYKFQQNGMDWVKSVDFSEPVKVSIKQNGKFYLEDGHHRWFAAKKLGLPLTAEVEIKAKPIETILQRQKGSNSIHAALAEKYWIDPSGKEIALGKYGHLDWIYQNWQNRPKDLSKGEIEFETSQKADEMLSDGWTRVTNETDGTDFALEVGDMNRIPSYIDTFIAQHYTGGGIEIDDLNGNYLRIEDPFPSLERAIRKASHRPVHASVIKIADFNHAYWIAPDSKVFEVRGATGHETSPKTTHSTWIADNLSLLKDQYNIKPVRTQWGLSLGSSDLLEQGWTRIGDGYSSDWGITVPDIKHISPSVDSLLAQFAHDGATITIEDKNWQNNATFDWPVKSIQQAVNQALLRQKETPAFEPQLAARQFPLSKREIKAFNPYQDESLKQGPAYAIFEHTQKGIPEFNVPDIKMYTILGNHPLFGSTVAEGKLEELNIPIRQTKQAQTKKVKQGEYGAVMALIPHNVAQEIVEWGVRNIPDKDVYDNPDKPRLGRELESHITIKYGLLTEDAKTVRRFFNESKPFKAKLGKVRHFQPPEMDFDVVTVEVISEDLEKINSEVTDKFECAEGLPSDTYHPHITVSYVKRDTAKDYIGSTEFEGTEVELDTIIFSPAKGNRTYFSISQDKESSFILQEINKTGGLDVRYWVDPNGKVYLIEKESSHFDWVSNNQNLLSEEYGLEPNIRKRDETQDLFNRMLITGWVRVGDSDEGIGIELKDLRNIPSNIDSVIDPFLGYEGDSVLVEDINHKSIRVYYPFNSLQDAVNKALSSPVKTADFLPSFVQAPDNAWQFAGGGEDKEIPVDPDAQSDEQTNMAPCTTGKPRKDQMWRELWHMIKSPFSKKESAMEAEEWDSHYGDIWHIGDKVKDKTTGKIGIIKTINGNEVELEEVNE